MVSGPGRRPPPSAAIRGHGGLEGRGDGGTVCGELPYAAGNRPEGCGVGSRTMGGGRDSGPSPRHGGWREQGRGLWVPRVLGLRLEPRAVPSHAQRFMGSRCRSAGALLSGLSPSTPRRGFSGPNTQVRPGSHAYPQASVLREWGA